MFFRPLQGVLGDGRSHGLLAFEPPIFSFSARRKRENGPFTVHWMALSGFAA